jgi:hypothetical protein
MTEPNNSEKRKVNPVVVIIFAALVGLYLMADLGGWFKGSNDSSNATENNSSIDYRNIKTLEQLKEYQRERANSMCQSWQKLQKLNNADNKNSEMDRLNFLYFNDADNVRSILKINDLPKEWLYPATNETKKVLEGCGFEVQKRF